MLESKTLRQIHQEAYKLEHYKIVREKGIGASLDKPKRKNQHYKNDIERLENTRKRSREYQRKNILESKTQFKLPVK